MLGLSICSLKCIYSKNVSDHCIQGSIWAFGDTIENKTEPAHMELIFFWGGVSGVGGAYILIEREKHETA